MRGIQNNLNIRGSASLRDKPVPPPSRTPPVSLAPKIPTAFPRSNRTPATQAMVVPPAYPGRVVLLLVALPLVKPVV